MVGDTPGPIPPCGMCRQVISEFADNKTQIVMANLKGDYKIDEEIIAWFLEILEN